MARHRITLAALATIAAFLLISCAQSTLAERVEKSMENDPLIKEARIEASVNGNVVTLKGNVDSEAEKIRALQVARATEGVTEVVDMIAVRNPGGTGDAPHPDRTLGERIDDAGITASVKGRLLDDPMVKGLRIDVDTRDGVVYLTGSVNTAEERDRAIQLARGADHVRDVQANLTIEPR